MEFEWDPVKARENVENHKIRFADATTVFDDDLAIHFPDEDHDESRFLLLGMDAEGRVLVVIFTFRDEDVIRIISARKANKRERKQYDRTNSG